MYELQRRLTAALGDRYQVGGRLGSGTTAVVFLARDLKHDREVALKVLRPEFALSLGNERFLREIRLVAGFTHPHILPLYDSGEADTLLYYSMPLARGGSLRTKLATERQLAVTDAVRIAYQVATALAYAHTRGVVHRDIKPENILLEEGQVLLADFGLARAGETPVVQLTDPGLAVGTPVYMSPEQAAGMQVDGRSDVYSLGCVLFEMLDGEAPFTGRSAEVVLARHRSEQPRSLDVSRPGLPPALKAAVQRALAKVPADRFSSAAAFAEAIRGAVEGTISASGGVPIAPVRRSRWREVAAAVAVLSIPAVIVARGLTGENTAALKRQARDPSRVAVMFFDGKDRAGLIAQGVTEELIDQLSAVPALNVVSAGGVRPLKGRSAPPDSIGRVLGVGTIVAGSIHEERDSVFATVRMIDGNDGHQSNTFVVAEPRTQVGALSGALAAAVGEELRREIGTQVRVAVQRAGAHDALAWEFTKQAQQLGQDGAEFATVHNFDRAHEMLLRGDSLLARAIDRDPTWVQPWLERAWLQNHEAQIGLARQPVARGHVDSATAAAVAFADRALRGSEDSSKAFEVRGVARYLRWRGLAADPDLEEAEQDLLRATALRPGLASAWKSLAQVYQAGGRNAEASLAARHALASDSYLTDAPNVMSMLLITAVEADRLDEASKVCGEGRKRFPEDFNFIECPLLVGSRTGHSRRGLDSLRTALADVERSPFAGPLALTRPVRMLWFAAALARSGLRDSAAAISRVALGTSTGMPRDRLGFYYAPVLLETGQRDSAIAELRRYVRNNPTGKQAVASSPVFRPLRDDETFRSLIAPR